MTDKSRFADWGKKFQEQHDTSQYKSEEPHPCSETVSDRRHPESSIHSSVLHSTERLRCLSFIGSQEMLLILTRRVYSVGVQLNASNAKVTFF